jgi:hypothetical protein
MAGTAPGPLSGSRIVAAALAGILVLGVLLRLRGLSVGLWLDEAWVANSVLADSLAGMFVYERWLQTTPPVVLLLVRSTTEVLGTSNAAFRLVPWLFGAGAIAGFGLLARKVLSPWVAVLATALVVFSPTAIDYSRELKQYSAELCCGTILLALSWMGWTRDRPLRPWIVLPVLFAAPLAAYGSVFLLPGLVLSQIRPFPEAVADARLAEGRAGRSGAGWSGTAWSGAGWADAGWIRAALRRCLAMAIVIWASGAVIIQLLQRNASPLLLRFWWTPDPVGLAAWLEGACLRLGMLLSLLPGVGGFLGNPAGMYVALACVGGILAAGTLAAARAGGERRRETWIVVGVCGFPIAAMFAAHLLHLYPWQDRTSLILLSALVLLIAHPLDTLCGRGSLAGDSTRRFVVASLATPLFTLLVAAGVEREVRRPVASKEDVQGAVEFLATAAGPGEPIYVHASVREAFSLYSRLRNWSPPGLLWGESGWPCCPRGLERRESPGEILERHDLARLVPDGYRGRVWAIVTERPGHREYLGVDLRRLLLRDMEVIGCGAPVERGFDNVLVLACDHGGAQLGESVGGRGGGGE